MLPWENHVQCRASLGVDSIFKQRPHTYSMGRVIFLYGLLLWFRGGTRVLGTPTVQPRLPHDTQSDGKVYGPWYREQPAANCSSEPKCRCHVSANYTLSADCSNLGITVIPYFHPNVTRIYLQGNEIQNVSIDAGQLPDSLVYLNMSNNKIHKFIGDPFQSMELLGYLDLSHNILKYHSLVYPETIFKGLKRLKYLNLQHNHDRNCAVNVRYPVSISGVTTLNHLLVDGVDTVGFSAEFNSLTKLESLDMNGATGICKIEHFKSNYFENLPFIQYLNISNCQTRHIDVGTFRNFSNLQWLNISNNEHLTFHVLGNVTDDLKWTPIHTLDISKLHCDYGPGTMIYAKDFINMKNHTYLTYLYIDKNRLSQAEQGILRDFPKSLKFISVKENRLTFGKYVFDIFSFPSLEVFDAGHQYTSHYPAVSSMDCNDWRAPPGSDNTATSSGFSDLSNSPQIRNVHTHLPIHLKTVYFNGCNLNYNVSSMIPFAPNNLTHLYLHNNVLYSLIGPVTNMQQLKYLDLSNNFCTYISDVFFNDCLSLEILLVRENLLGYSLYKDVTGSIFKTLKYLTKIDLSFNRIENLPHFLLKYQRNLQTLSISNNKLSDFQLHVSHMTKLQFLDISFNQLQQIKENERKELDAVKGGNLTVNLEGNPLECSCITLDFLEWLNDNKQIFHNFQHYTCRLQNDTITTFSHFGEIITGLKRSCASYVTLIVGVTSAIVLCVTVTISGLVYRYRWKLRYLYYMAKSRYRGYTAASTGTDHENNYIYDAFISYCEQDGRFVRDKLLENLEERSGLHLCLHERDFIPGQDIAENITQAIHQSRKTVVILSQNYIKSYWCKYEFNMARMESIYSRGGNSVLLVVFYENVSANDMPLTFLDVIESRSYIEYPNDEQADVVFWQKLSDTLSQ